MTGKLDTDCSAQTVLAWRQFIPLMPEELYDALSANVPYFARYDFGIDTYGCGKIDLDLTDGDRLVAEARRRFCLGEGVAYNDAFVIWHPEDRGIGICRHFMYNVFKIYKDWDIHTIYCSAGLTDGGFTWARHGFKISREEWLRLRPELHSRLWAQSINWAIQAEVARLIDKDDPMGLWFVSDLTDPCGTSTLGKVLLSGLSWEGTFRFGDQSCVDRFNGHVGAKL